MFEALTSLSGLENWLIWLLLHDLDMLVLDDCGSLHYNLRLLDELLADLAQKRVHIDWELSFL